MNLKGITKKVIAGAAIAGILAAGVGFAGCVGAHSGTFETPNYYGNYESNNGQLTKLDIYCPANNPTCDDSHASSFYSGFKQCYGAPEKGVALLANHEDGYCLALSEIKKAECTSNEYYLTGDFVFFMSGCSQAREASAKDFDIKE